MHAKRTVDGSQNAQKKCTSLQLLIVIQFMHGSIVLFRSVAP
jgi:hypothetical protein